MPKPINHSIGCYYERCREHVENTSPTRSFSLAIEETHEAAGKAGWVMGLDSNGQAHYGCPYHGGALFDARPLQGWFTKRQKRGLAIRAEQETAGSRETTDATQPTAPQTFAHLEGKH